MSRTMPMFYMTPGYLNRYVVSLDTSQEHILLTCTYIKLCCGVDKRMVVFLQQALGWTYGAEYREETHEHPHLKPLNILSPKVYVMVITYRLI